MTPSLTPQLSPTLLRELPRLFGGLQGLLRELLQNSLHAGAPKIEFDELDSGFRALDAGPGLPDPQFLFTAGRSGWGEEVIEPAGLGLFATLDPELVAKVTISSNGWSVTLTPDLLERPQAVAIEQRRLLAGFEVEVHFKNPPGDLRAHLSAARGKLPLTVLLGGEILEPRKTQAVWHRVSSAVGQFEYGRSLGLNGNHTLYWEGQPLSGLETALERAAENDLQRALIKAGQLEYTPAAQSGVRPTLPARTSVRDDPALESALRLGLGALEGWTRSSFAALTLKPTLGAEELWRLQQPSGVPERVLRVLFREAGYRAFTRKYWADARRFTVEDGEDSEVPGTRMYSTEALQVADEGECDTANALYSLGLFPRQAATVRGGVAAQVEGLQKGDVLGLASRITLGGFELPCLLQPRFADSDSAEPLIVMAGTFEQALHTLERTGETLGGMLLEHGYWRSLLQGWEWSGGDLYADEGARVLRALLVEEHGTVQDQTRFHEELGARELHQTLSELLDQRALPPLVSAALEAMRPALEALRVQCQPPALQTG